MRRISDSELLGALLLICLVGLMAAAMPAHGAPITSSLSTTVEHGPDGWCTIQTIAFEWQVLAEWRPALLYDVWWGNKPSATRQLDVNITWEPQAAKKPLTITAGRRWHLGQDGQGPAWVYGTVSIGW